MTIKFTCEYNGKDFCGFQRQKNLRTVQQVLEDALSRYFGEQVKIAGSGRTDTGVHAKGQVVSFRISNTPSSALRLPPLYSEGNSVIVGPEGGFTETERAALHKVTQPISLGSRILRAETAAIVAATLLRWGVDQ